MPTPIGAVDAARFGMSFERMRLEAASQNMALANVPLRPGDSASLRSVAVTGSFQGYMGTPVMMQQADSEAAPKMVHDPRNPLADADGYVRYLNVEPSFEMTTLVSASRAYEANVRAFNALHQMEIKSLEIGGRR